VYVLLVIKVLHVINQAPKGASRISAGWRPAVLALYYLSSEGAIRDIKKFCNV